jgi:hypothetical protein
MAAVKTKAAKKPKQDADQWRKDQGQVWSDANQRWEESPEKYPPGK